MTRNECVEAMLACDRDPGRILRVVRAYLAECVDKSGNECWLIHKMFFHAVNGFMS